MSFIKSLKGIFPKKQPVTLSPLDRHNAMNQIADDWSEWDPKQNPPSGWVWIKDVVLSNGWCLVSLSRGCLDKITRAEWRKVRRRRLKIATTVVMPE